MNHKKIILTESFDTSFFVIGEAYQITDNELATTRNYLLNDIHGDWITFYDEDGEALEISLDEYKENYDILRLVPTGELISVEPVPTISAEPEYMETTTDVDDNGIPEKYKEPFVVCREVDYEKCNSHIIHGDTEKLDVYKHLDKKTRRGVRINRFYYRVEVLKMGDDFTIRKARYYVSDKPLYGFKLHPLFEDASDVFIEPDMIDDGDTGEILVNKSYDEFIDIIKEEYDDECSMVSVEMMSAIQMLAIVELGAIGANAEAIGKRYHCIYNLFNEKATFVEGLKIKGKYVYVREDGGVAFYGNPLSKFIRYFMYSEEYDWLFLPAVETDTADNSIGCATYIKNDSKYIAFLGGYWYGGSGVGLFYWNLSSASSASCAGVGSRVMRIKREKEEE
jgi:hypothetical protein